MGELVHVGAVREMSVGELVHVGAVREMGLWVNWYM